MDSQTHDYAASKLSDQN